jgi:lipoprotein-releasing system permease protein
LKTSSYERLVGWRYLFRRRKQPKILYIGLALLIIGMLLAIAGFQLEQTSGRTVSVFGAFTMGRGLIAGGTGLFAIALATVLFGLLNRSMTLFTAFSTFMVAIGVSEVILVLAIMNGLHEDLGEKIVATKAHVVVKPSTSNEFISNYKQLSDQIKALPGVAGATPMLDTEVMLSSVINRIPTKMIGVNWRSLKESSEIPNQIDEGCLNAIETRGQLCKPLLVELSKPGQDAVTKMNPQTPSAAKSSPPAQAEMATSSIMAFPAPAAPSLALPANVLIGSEMKKNLSVNLGEKLTAISPFGDLGPTGPIPKKQVFNVTGWFSSGMLEFDSHLVYADLREVQKFLGLNDVVNQIQIKAVDINKSAMVSAAIRKHLGENFTVTDWRQRDQRLFSALQLEKIAMFIVLGINIILAAFSIVSTLVMTILERRKEVAIFSAMGATRAAIFRIFLTQGAYIGLIGALLGALIGGGLSIGLEKLGLPLNQEVYYISAVPVSIEVADVVIIVGVALLVSILSTVYPARLAARINTIEGLGA